MNARTVISLTLGILISRWIGHTQLQYHGPNSEQVKQTVYQWDNHCYRFTPFPVTCPLHLSRKQAGSH